MRKNAGAIDKIGFDGFPESPSGTDIPRSSHPHDKMKFGSVGNGSSRHLVAEMLIAATRIELTHVPYRGEAPVVPDLATGRIDLMFMASAKRREKLATRKPPALQSLGVRGAP